MARFEVTHPGVPGVEVIEAESDGEKTAEEVAIELFRAKHGKIQTVHEYGVKPLDGAVAKADK